MGTRGLKLASVLGRGRQIMVDIKARIPRSPQVYLTAGFNNLPHFSTALAPSSLIAYNVVARRLVSRCLRLRRLIFTYVCSGSSIKESHFVTCTCRRSFECEYHPWARRRSSRSVSGSHKGHTHLYPQWILPCQLLMDLLRREQLLHSRFDAAIQKRGHFERRRYSNSHLHCCQPRNEWNCLHVTLLSQVNVFFWSKGRKYISLFVA